MSSRSSISFSCSSRDSSSLYRGGSYSSSGGRPRPGCGGDGRLRRRCPPPPLARRWRRGKRARRHAAREKTARG